MDQISIIQIIASILTAGITAFAVVAFKLGKYSEKVDQLEKCDLNSRLSKLEGQFQQINTTNAFLRKESPIALNEKGEKLLRESGGSDFLSQNFETLFEAVENKGPQTPYDVQEMSKEVLSAMRDSERFNPLKDYAFKEGLELETLISVMGIALRDMILNKKHWKVEDVDKYDPAHSKEIKE